jgi:hypothetical protein
MSKPVDMRGQTFTRLTAVERVESNKRGRARWRCLCVCGGTTVASRANLLTGAVRSCGCLRDDVHRERVRTGSLSNFKHGYAVTEARSGLHRSWSSLKWRCDTGSPGFHRYGRGIRYDERWADFAVFREEMEAGWFEGAELHRRDVDGPYCSENCVWLDRSSHRRLHAEMRRRAA